MKVVKTYKKRFDVLSAAAGIGSTHEFDAWLCSFWTLTKLSTPFMKASCPDVATSLRCTWMPPGSYGGVELLAVAAIGVV